MTIFQLHQSAATLSQKLAVIGIDGMIVGGILFTAGAILSLGASFFTMPRL
jgi:hypothetical protein